MSPSLLLTLLAQATGQPLPYLPHGPFNEYVEINNLCVAMGPNAEVTLNQNFVRFIDLNGDGVEDFIVDWAGAECSESPMVLTAGTDGSYLKVYFGNTLGTRPLYNAAARDWRVLDTPAGRVLRLTVSGSEACGASNRSENCEVDVQFAGKEWRTLAIRRAR